MPMVNDPIGFSGQPSTPQPPTSQDQQAVAFNSFDAVRWFFNVIAPSQHDEYTSIRTVAGTLG
jgi:hypothetical protein